MGCVNSKSKRKKNIQMICGVSGIGKTKTIQSFKGLYEDIEIKKIFLDIIEMANHFNIHINENLTFDRCLYTLLYNTVFYNRVIKDTIKTNCNYLIDRSIIMFYFSLRGIIQGSYALC